MTVAICIASGPSLTAEDVAYCRGKGRVYVVNNCYQLAPWADVLYACDGAWWDCYHQKVLDSKFEGELWTLDVGSICKYDLHSIGVHGHVPFSKVKDAIATGGNSGFQAMNLAYVQGASKIILLGYDMKPRADGVLHWHGNHVPELVHTMIHEYPNFAKRFEEAAPHIDIPVINCTVDSALECFEKKSLRETI